MQESVQGPEGGQGRGSGSGRGRVKCVVWGIVGCMLFVRKYLLYVVEKELCV